MNEFLLATALLMQEHLFPFLVVLATLFVVGVTFSVHKMVIFAGVTGWAALALYGLYLV